VRTLVVARHKESISWIGPAIQALPFGRVEIYNKGSSHPDRPRDPRISVRRVPNRGREGGTYLDYIVENHADMPRGVWFTQGDPFHHSPDFIGLLRCFEEYESKAFQGLTVGYNGYDCPPGNCHGVNDAFKIGGNRCSHYFIKDMQVVGHCGFFNKWLNDSQLRPFEMKYGTRDVFGYISDRIGIAPPGPITETVYGACFYAGGAAITRHPRWVYERTREFLMDTDDQGGFQGFMLEHFWPYLLTGRSYKTLSDCYRSLLAGGRNAVYCSDRKKAWIKSPDGLLVEENPTTTIIFFREGQILHLPGIDIIGRDLMEFEAETPELAMNLIAEVAKYWPCIKSI